MRRERRGGGVRASLRVIVLGAKGGGEVRGRKKVEPVA